MRCGNIDHMGWAMGGVRFTRRRLVALALTTLSLLLACGVAGRAEPPHYCQVRPATQLGPIVCIGPPSLSFEALAGFAPRALPRSGQVPIAFHLTGKVEAGRGSPPPLEEVVLELDRHASIDATAFPACGGSVVRGGIAKARRLCGGSIVGAGSARVEIEGQKGEAPRAVGLPVTVFSGGTSNGGSRLLFRFEPIPPARAPLLAIGESRAMRNGRFGSRLSIAFPSIEEGKGAIVRFGFGLRRRAPGGTLGIVRAACPDRRLVFRALGLFRDGTRLSGSSLRACSPLP